MNRIAICVSGDTTNWDKCIDSWNNICGINQVDLFCQMYNNSDNEQVLAAIKPKRYEVSTGDQSSVNNLYGILIANQLKNSHEIDFHFVYDIVINIKYNVLVNSVVDLSKISTNMFNGFDLKPIKFVYQISDLFWITSSEINDRVSNLYHDINSIKRYDEELKNNQQYILYHHIRKNNIDVSVHNWDISQYE